MVIDSGGGYRGLVCCYGMEKRKIKLFYFLINNLFIFFL